MKSASLNDGKKVGLWCFTLLLTNYKPTEWDAIDEGPSWNQAEITARLGNC